MSATAFKLSAEFIASVIGPTLELEGGISDDPRDRGGLTKFGISENSYPEARDDDFSMFDAIDIYKKIAIDSRTAHIVKATGDRRFGAAFFQFEVNTGNNRAMKLLQVVINRAGGRLKVDGLYGPKTEAALVNWHAYTGSDGAIRRYLDACAGWYLCNVERTGQRHYLDGWVNRVGRHFNAALDSNVEQRLLAMLEANEQGSDPTQVA